MYIYIHSFILACVHASITCICLESIIINRCDLTLHFYDFLFYNFSIKLFVEEKSFLSRLISIGSLPLGRRQADDITASKGQKLGKESVDTVGSPNLSTIPYRTVPFSITIFITLAVAKRSVFSA